MIQLKSQREIEIMAHGGKILADTMTPALRVAIEELMRQVEEAGGSLIAFLAAHSESGGYGV